MAHRAAYHLLPDTWTGPLLAFLALLMALPVVAACGAADDPVGVGPPAQEPAGRLAARADTANALREIATYAGSGSSTFEGDGGPATESGFFAPNGVALDDKGNLLISTDNRVRKVEATNGIITTFAGTGRNRSDGDGAPATDASLADPKSIGVDGFGNVFIVENGSGRIRMVDATTGIITTVAGGGIGDPRKNIFGDGGPATQALIKSPDYVAVDREGSLYIATDNRIRRVDAATGVIVTVAGTGQRGLKGDGGPATEAELAEPVGIALDGQRTIYIADSDNHRVRKVDGATGTITTVAGIGKHYERTTAAYMSGDWGPISKAAATGAGYAGDGGPANQAMLHTPSAISLDRDGNIFIAEGGIRVRKVDSASGTITTVVAGESETSYETGKIQVHTGVVGELVSIAVNDLGEIFLADKKNNVVHKVSASVGP